MFSYRVNKLMVVFFLSLGLGACGGGSSSSSANSDTSNPLHAYVLAHDFVQGTSELKILDIAQPATPVLRGSQTLISPARLAVNGDTVFVSNLGPAGPYMHIIDVSTPSAPASLLQQNGNSDFGVVSDLYIHDSVVYLADSYTGLKIADFNNGSFNLHANFTQNNAADALAINELGGFIYLLHASISGVGFGLEKFSLANLAQVSSTGVYNSQSSDIGNGATFDSRWSLLENDGSDLYLADLGSQSLRKFDPSNLNKTQELNIGGQPTAMAIDAGRAYITMHPSAYAPYNVGLSAVIMVDLASMTIIDTVTLNKASGVAINNATAFVTDADALYVYDVSGNSFQQLAQVPAGAGFNIVLGQ